MPRVIVKISPRISRDLRQGSLESRETRDLIHSLNRLGIDLRPQHPGADDPDLGVWFEIDAADEVKAEQVIIRLRRFSAIEAAYIKPLDSQPRN